MFKLTTKHPQFKDLIITEFYAFLNEILNNFGFIKLTNRKKHNFISFGMFFSIKRN